MRNALTCSGLLKVPGSFATTGIRLQKLNKAIETLDGSRLWIAATHDNPEPSRQVQRKRQARFSWILSSHGKV